MDIYLIRHGESHHSAAGHFDREKRAMDPPLTEKGVVQAQRLAARCRRLAFELIISSDLARAVHTAEIIRGTAPCPLSIDPAFREIDMGDVHLKSWAPFPERYALWSRHDADIRYPGGECGLDVWNRCRPRLDVLCASDRERVALVCHGGTIRSIICGALGIPQEKRFLLGAPPGNCSISILKHSKKDGRYCLHRFNDCAHLSESE